MNKFTPEVIGGVEAHVGTLARFLAQRDDVTEVKVLGFQPVAAPPPATYQVVPIKPWLQLGSLPLGPGLGAALRHTAADIVHLHLPSGLPELQWLVTGDRRPLVITYHAPALRLGMLRPAYRRILKWLFGRASRILATSPAMLAPGSELWPYRHKVIPVPLGVDPAPLRPTPEVMERARSLRVGHPVVLFVGRLVNYKGLDVLLRAMPAVEALAGGVHWVVVGDGPRRRHLANQARRLGLTSRLTFAGTVTAAELAAYYHAATLLVLPSVTRAEGYGLVQVEAHLCGLPVVSTDLPTGVPFVNRDGETGLVVPPRSADALAQAIGRLLLDAQLRSRLGEAARARAQELFSAETMADRVLAVYREALAGAG